MIAAKQALNILVAEDDPDDRYLIQEAFRKAPHPCRIRFVGDGIELMDYLSGREGSGNDVETPAIILLDLNMPRKDGRETLREIKAHHKFRCIPVVIFTTSAEEDDVANCYCSGAATYIVKPESFAEMVSMVETFSKYWCRTAQLDNQAA